MRSTERNIILKTINQMMMKAETKGRVWLAMAALLPLMAVAQTPPDTAKITRHELSIQQAVDYANKNSIQVKNALIDVLLQKETNRQVTASAYPSISANGNLTDNLKLQTTLLPGEFLGQPPGSLVPITFGTKYITNASADLNQILFDGQVFVGLQARKTSIDVVNKNVEVTQENIKANVYKVYYQLVVSKIQIALIDSNISLQRKQQHDIEIMYKNGFASQLDIDRATVGLANLQTQRERTIAGIANGYYGLKTLIGMPINQELVLTDTLSDEQIKEGVLENTAFQYTDRKDYQYLELTRNLYAFNIRRYKLSKLPTVSLGASYSKQFLSNDLKFGDKWFTSAYVALRVSVPIFKGFETNSKISAARLTVQQLENQLQGLQITIDNDVATARNNFTTAITAMDFQKKNMALAQTVYNQTKKEYEIGTASSTDLQAAQTDLQAAQNNYINAVYDAIIAKTDFLKATGKL